MEFVAAPRLRPLPKAKWARERGTRTNEDLAEPESAAPRAGYRGRARTGDRPQQPHCRSATMFDPARAACTWLADSKNYRPKRRAEFRAPCGCREARARRHRAM